MNYNYIAPYYDFLSKICFLNRQQMAHRNLLKHLNPNDKILWIGGGSGWFLKELDVLNIPLKIDYIEFSEVMINKARTIKLDNLDVRFYQEDILKFVPNNKYDVIITAFIFDHFTVQECESIFDKINSQLLKNGLFFYVDFSENQNLIQRFLTKAMVYFFQIVAGIKTNDFPKIDYLFAQFSLVEEEYYFMEYIHSRIYRK